MVAHLAESGTTQFLDLGCGLPAPGNVHEIAQRVRPEAKVVYVDMDPIVLAHARALLATDARTIAVAGDLRDPRAILDDPQVRDHLDFTRPIAVLFLAVLHFVAEEHEPAAIVDTFRDALVPGSHIVITHAADLPEHEGAVRAAATREAAGLYQDLTTPFTLRTQAQITELFAGLTLVRPGVVPARLWRPGRGHRGPAAPILGGLGRIPCPQDQTRIEATS